MKAVLCSLTVMAFSSLFFSISVAKTWFVKPDGTGDAPTIQAAVNSATPGDTVVLTSGTFTGPGNLDVDYTGKAITITSQAGPDSTVIDCQRLGRGFYFENGEDSSSVLSLVTIRNGDALRGGAIYSRFSSPTLIGNVIEANTATSDGGGIYYVISNDTVSSRIAGNVIRGNTAGDRGGGVFIVQASPIVEANLITGNQAGRGGGIAFSTSGSVIRSNVVKDNTATEQGGGVWGSGAGKRATLTGNTISGNYAAINGGGIYLEIADPIIENTLIVDNDIGILGAGVYCSVAADPTIRNCTIAWNGGGTSGGGVVAKDGNPSIETTIIAFTTHGAGLLCFGSAAPTLVCCDIFGNVGGDALCGIDGGGNISADPLFCDAAVGDFATEPASPCTQANSPCGERIGALAPDCVVAGIQPQTVAFEIALYQNAPNPFNPSTAISFNLSERTATRLSIYDIEGKLVATLVDETLDAGFKEVTWHGKDARGNQVSTGVYFYRLTAGKRTLTKKMVLLK